MFSGQETKSGWVGQTTYNIAQPFGWRRRYQCNEEQLEGKSGGHPVPAMGTRARC